MQPVMQPQSRVKRQHLKIEEGPEESGRGDFDWILKETGNNKNVSRPLRYLMTSLKKANTNRIK